MRSVVLVLSLIGAISLMTSTSLAEDRSCVIYMWFHKPLSISFNNYGPTSPEERAHLNNTQKFLEARIRNGLKAKGYTIGGRESFLELEVRFRRDEDRLFNMDGPIVAVTEPNRVGGTQGIAHPDAYGENFAQVADNFVEVIPKCSEAKKNLSLDVKEKISYSKYQDWNSLFDHIGGN